MTAKTIQIVDRGRGAQLSTSRITVQDLVPYFQEGCSHDDIRRAMPSLSSEEISVVEDYYRQHQIEMNAEDRRIRERIALQRNPPEVEEILRRGGDKLAALRDDFRRRGLLQEAQGDHADR